MPPVGRELDCAKLLKIPNSVYLKCIKTFETMEITITLVVNVNINTKVTIVVKQVQKQSYTVRVSKLLNQFNDGAFPLYTTLSAQCLVRQENVKSKTIK